MIAEENSKSSSCDLNQEESLNEEIYPESTTIGAGNSTKCGLSSSNVGSYQVASGTSIKGQEEEQYNKNKALSYQMIMKQQIKPHNMFYLRGELFIDLNFNDFSRISNLNYFKQVRSATIVKDYGLLYIDYQVDSKLFDDHSRVVQILKNYSDSEIQNLAEKIENHEKIQLKHSEVKQQIMRYSSLNNITTQLMAAKRQEFMVLRKDILSSLPKNRYFSFVDFSFDYNDQTFKMIGSGMNEQFVKLLGCDFQNMQDILMRKGILDFIEGKSKWRFLQKIVDNVQVKGQEKIHYEDRIGMITLDDILIDANFTSDFYNCQSNKIFENFFHPDYQDYLIDRGFLVFELLLTDFHIRKINTIRQKNIEDFEKYGSYDNVQNQFDLQYKPYILPYENEKSNDMDEEMNDQMNPPTLLQQNNQPTTLYETNQSMIIQDLTTDIPYSIQSQYFLDKYYNKNKPQPQKEPNLQDKFPSKTCKYRTINQKS